MSNNFVSTKWQLSSIHTPSLEHHFYYPYLVVSIAETVMSDEPLGMHQNHKVCVLRTTQEV